MSGWGGGGGDGRGWAGGGGEVDQRPVPVFICNFLTTIFHVFEIMFAKKS